MYNKNNPVAEKIANLFRQVKSDYVAARKVVPDGRSSIVYSPEEVHAYFLLIDEKTGIHMQGYPLESSESLAKVWARSVDKQQLMTRKAEGLTKELFPAFGCGVHVTYDPKILEARLASACPALK